MQHWYYLTLLLICLAGLAYGDYVKKIALFWNYRLVLRIILSSVVFFLVWDIAGIGLHVFSTNSAWVSGLNLGSPNLPIEELLFLIFFSYLTMLVWRLVCTRTPS